MLGASRLTLRNLSPSYSIGLAPSLVQEGVAGGYIYLTASVFSNEVSLNEVVAWEIVSVSGTVNASDFDVSSGFVTLNGNQNNFNIGVKGDSLTEGTESFFVRIRNASQQILANSNTVTIQDTSTNATYTLTAPFTVSNPNEGASTTFSLTTTNVPNGQLLQWTIRPASGNQQNPQPTAADFTIGTLTGTMTINNNQGSLILQYVADNTFEGSEAYYLDITRMDGTTLTSPLVNIQDTSDGGASLKIYPDAYGLGENLKLALPFRVSTQFNDISWQFFESTQNTAATRTGPTGVVIQTSGQRFYDGHFNCPGTQTPGVYTLSSSVNTRGNFCIMFYAKTTSSDWNNWVIGNNRTGSGEVGISLSTYSSPTSPNGDTIRSATEVFDRQLVTYRAGDGAAGRIGYLNSNQWYHFCFTKTGWWVNGDYMGTITWDSTTWSNIVIGGQYNTSGGFVGGIQDVRVYVGTNVVADYANFVPPNQMIPT